MEPANIDKKVDPMPIEKCFLLFRKLVRENSVYVMRKLFDHFLTGSVLVKRTVSCIICGTEKNITKEHVLPRWVFENCPKKGFVPDVNKLQTNFISATLPACRRCNTEVLNRIEQYIQRTLAGVDHRNGKFTIDEWENIIRWLEIIDYKFQVWDLSTNFLKHKSAPFVQSLSQFSIAFMRHLSVRRISTLARKSRKRMATKNKSDRAEELIMARSNNGELAHFHTSGHYLFLDLPGYNRAFFYFFEENHKNGRATVREAKKIIQFAYRREE